MKGLIDSDILMSQHVGAITIGGVYLVESLFILLVIPGTIVIYKSCLNQLNHYKNDGR